MTDILLLGEAWGEREEELGQPFVGASGYILDKMLEQAGIRRRDCYITNVFNLRPRPSNDILNLCGPESTAIRGLPPLQRGKWVRSEFSDELNRLYTEIVNVQPNVIVALGATAAWATLHSTGIKAIRGAVATTCRAVTNRLQRSVKVLPTYHPAAIAREWKLRPIAIADLEKARRESTNAEFHRPTRHIWIKPTLEDLYRYERQFILPADSLAADIETIQDQITCIGFAPSTGSCIVIPFYSSGQSDGNYWRTLEEELEAWRYVRRWLALRPTIFQNGMYDISFLWRSYGIPVPLATEDTMLMHHAWQPEMEKGLGFLGTIYTDEASWKHMRKGTRHD